MICCLELKLFKKKQLCVCHKCLLILVQPDFAVEIMASYAFFKRKLSAQQQFLFLQLYGPTEAIHKVGLRDKEKLPFNEQEQNDFVQIGGIYSVNVFSNQEENRLVFNDITRMSHSCIPNCYVDLLTHSAVVRCITPVKAGDGI